MVKQKEANASLVKQKEANAFFAKQIKPTTTFNYNYSYNYNYNDSNRYRNKRVERGTSPPHPPVMISYFHYNSLYDGSVAVEHNVRV